MHEGGDSDSGGTEKTAQSEDATVELRKSCDYCVRLKRACDGKNPCTLCSRRKKPCTRSARKKSGPAKGTKYAPRRKRSAIAEWADRAAVGAGGDPEHSHDAAAIGLATDSGGMSTLELSASPLATPPGTPSSFLGGRASSSRRGEGDGGGGGGGRTGEAPTGAGAQRLEPGSPLSPSVSTFRAERFEEQREQQQQQQEQGDEQGQQEGGLRSRRLPPRLEPAPAIGSSAAAGSSLAPQQEHGAPAAWTTWAEEATSRSGLSRLEAAAAAAVEAAAAAAAEPRAGGGGGGSGSGGSGSRDEPGVYTPGGAVVPFLPPPGPMMGVDPRRVRTREPPMEWGSSPDTFMGPSGPTHSGRIRLSAPSVPLDTRSTRQLSPGVRVSTSSPRGGAASRSPERRRESVEQPQSSSPSFRPLPREPPDPMAGFSFRPSAQLMSLSWRRSPQFAPWDVHGRDPPGLMAPRGPSPSRDSHVRSLERGRVGAEDVGGGAGAGEGGGGGRDFRRRRVMGIQEGEVGWPQPLPFPLPRVSESSHPFDHHRPREWNVADDDRQSRFSSSAARDRRQDVSPRGAGSFERQRLDRPEDRHGGIFIGGVVGGMGSASGAGYAQGFGGGSSGGGGDGGVRERRVWEERQQLNSRQHGRQGWGFDYRVGSVMSPQLQGERGAEARSDDEQQAHWRAGVGARGEGESGGGGSQGGGTPEDWDADRSERRDRGDREIRHGGGERSGALGADRTAPGIDSATALQTEGADSAAPSTARTSGGESSGPGDAAIGSLSSSSSRLGRRSLEGSPRTTAGGDEGWAEHVQEERYEGNIPSSLPRVHGLAGVADARAFEAPFRESEHGAWRPAWGGRQPQRPSGPPREDDKEEGMDESG